MSIPQLEDSGYGVPRVQGNHTMPDTSMLQALYITSPRVSGSMATTAKRLSFSTI